MVLLDIIELRTVGIPVPKVLNGFSRGINSEEFSSFALILECRLYFPTFSNHGRMGVHHLINDSPCSSAENDLILRMKIYLLNI